MKEHGNYWQSRINRRRALQLAGLTGAGALALSMIGCGGNNKNEGAKSSGGGLGLLYKPADTTSQAVKGGTLPDSTTQDSPSFDAIGSSAGPSFTHGTYTYSRLVKYTTGKYPSRPDGSVEADAATSWEVAPDGLRYIFKLRPNMKLDSRPPTSGRALNADDVVWSWNRFSTLSEERGTLVNSVSKDAPILSLEAPDKQTVVIKTAFPYVPLIQMLGFRRYLPIMPVEADGAFDLRSDMRGSGAWTLAKYTPSVGFEYRKNPDWYDASKVMLEGISLPIIPEYATALAQFRSGAIWRLASMRSEDVLPTKKDLPALNMKADDVFPRDPGLFTRFGAIDGDPFLDDRVRQALSMSIDRDLFIETFYNTKKFAAEGLDVQTRWPSHVPSGEEGLWLDPKGKDLGEGAAYFQLNPTEAKKLMTAAGYTQPVEFSYYYPTNSPAVTTPMVAVLAQMFSAPGYFKANPAPVDYTSQWQTKYTLGQGPYAGIGSSTQTARPEVDGHIAAAGAPGLGKHYWMRPDDELANLIAAQRKEFDRPKRVDLINQYQKYLAKKMYYLLQPGVGLGFGLSWNWIGNVGVFPPFDGGSESQESQVHLWYDASKRKA